MTEFSIYDTPHLRYPLLQFTRYDVSYRTIFSPVFQKRACHKRDGSLRYICFVTNKSCVGCSEVVAWFFFC